MIVIDSLIELANTTIPDGLAIRQHIREWTADTDYKKSFMTHFGGHIHVLEEFSDFAQVTFFGDDFRLRNLLCDYGAFDQCETIGYGSRTVVVHSCTSNSGGPTYYIPGELAITNPFVELSIQESN